MNSPTVFALDQDFLVSLLELVELPKSRQQGQQKSRCMCAVCLSFNYRMGLSYLSSNWQWQCQVRKFTEWHSRTIHQGRGLARNSALLEHRFQPKSSPNIWFSAWPWLLKNRTWNLLPPHARTTVQCSRFFFTTYRVFQKFLYAQQFGIPCPSPPFPLEL